MSDPQRQRLRVLLVEDDAVDRLAFERFTARQELPWDTVAAESLSEARQLLAQARFDLVITDYDLGDGDGLDVLALVNGTPVIVVTGAGDEATAVRAMRAGAYDYLIKDRQQRYLTMVPVTVEKARRYHASQQRAHMLTQALTSINYCVYVVDLEGRFMFTNQAFHEVYGYREDEILGRSQDILWAPEDPGEPGEGRLAPSNPGELRGGETGECRHLRRDGSELSVHLSRSPIVDAGGEPVAMVGAVRDISERKAWERALSESEERYALAAAGAGDGLWDWDLRRHQVYFSERWKGILGYADGEVAPTPEAWFELVHAEDVDLLKAQIEAYVEGNTPHFENEHRIRARDGDYRWVQAQGLAVRDAAGRAVRLAGSQRDVTDKKKVEEQLIHAALHDDLTGLPNRALFMDRLESAIGRVQRRSEHAFGVIFLDLDRFKVINDSLGHEAGDQLLRAIARRLESCLRIGDTVARLGGDEFAVLVEDLEDPAEADQVAERIHEELQAPFHIEGHEFFTSASLGIALSAEGYERPEEVLRDADTAMYRAKSMGRSRMVFNPDMHTSAVAQMQLENDLRRAVDRLEFQVYFQPIVALADGSLSHFEALVRWQHPERGLLAPGDFLPVANETGMGSRIVWWVLQESCRRTRSLRKRFPHLTELSVSVNLDAEQLASDELLEQVEAALAQSLLSPQSLQLEITEAMIIENPEVTAGILERLAERGIRLHVDDFGTGYSSLSQLHQFPVHSLKIDRSFVGRIGSEEDKLEIVRTIISLARTLGLEVMAEGVETREQLDKLRQLGCDYGQGYLFAKPMSFDEVKRLLASGPAPFPGF